MAATYEKIIKDLKRQQSIEGVTPETDLLLKIIDLKLVKSSSEWHSLVTVKYHRYGMASYQAHRFHYPSEMLLKLQTFFTQQANEND